MAEKVGTRGKKYKPGFRDIVRMGRQAFAGWKDDYASSMGAALSYYTFFSLGPLLLIVISLAGFFFGQDAARARILEEISALMGSAGALAIDELLGSFQKSSNSVGGAIIGVVVLLIGATSVFGELQDALDRIWRVPAPARQSGWMSLVTSRLLSFGLILSIGFLLIVSLVLSAALAALGRWWSASLAGWAVAAQIGDFILGLGLTTAAFAIIYKMMPRARVDWRDVWIGAAVTGLLFQVGKSLIGLYIGRSGVLSGFGASSSVVMLLVWVYYSAQIFLLGAEFTWVYAHDFGSLRDAPHEEIDPQSSDAPPSRSSTPPQTRTTSP